VRSVNGQEGALTLQGGGGTTINNSGGVFTISSSGGGGTGIQGVQSSDGSLAVTNPNGPTANLVLAPNAVQSAHLANDAVTAPKVAPGQVVKSVMVGSSTLHDDVTLTAGTGVTLTPTGNTVTIAAAGGSAGITELQNSNNTLTITNPTGPVTTVNIMDGGIGATQLATGAVTTAKISTAGAAGGQVLGYNGSAVAWTAPAGFAIPYANAISHPDPLFALTNTGAGRAGSFIIDNAASTTSALYGSTNSSGVFVPAVEGVSANGVGVLGRGGTASSGIFGVNSTGVAPISAGSGVCGFSDAGHGVAGISYNASSAGVNGFSDNGIGVRGVSTNGRGGFFELLSSSNGSPALEAITAGSGAGVRAVYSGAGVGCPLNLDGGPIRISGSNRMAFVHTATVANKITANGTEIDNAICNGDASAILIVTQLLNPANTTAYNNSAIGVYYDPSRQKWQVFNESAAAITTNAQFFVLVIKQ
jgi:hypothetical protein